MPCACSVEIKLWLALLGVTAGSPSRFRNGVQKRERELL